MMTRRKTNLLIEAQEDKFGQHFASGDIAISQPMTHPAHTLFISCLAVEVLYWWSDWDAWQGLEVLSGWAELPCQRWPLWIVHTRRS